MKMKCDKCDSIIKEEGCKCGKWFKWSAISWDDDIFEEAILTFDRSKAKILSMDHFSGNVAIFFKGTAKDVEPVRAFIRNNIFKEE